MTLAPIRASMVTVLAAVALAGTTAGSAQQVVTDTSRRPAVGDTVRPAAPGAAPADRVPPADGPGSTGAAPAPPPVNVGVAAPTDPTLARACVGMPAGSEAPGLLAVIFRTGTSDKDRAAAAKAVGGKLAGTSSYGEDYVELDPGAGPLTVVADRLIRQEPVMQVSPAPCPAEVPGAAEAGADSTAARSR